MYIYIYIFVFIYTYTENCIKPSAAIQDVLLLREHKLLSACRKYYKFSTSPFPSPCTCTLGTGHSPGVCLHLWVEKIQINSSEYMRLIKAGYVSLYRGMWLLPAFLLSAGGCGDSDTRRRKQEGARAGSSIPWSCSLPGPCPGGEQWEPGQSQPSISSWARWMWHITHHVSGQ